MDAKVMHISNRKTNRTGKGDVHEAWSNVHLGKQLSDHNFV